MNNDTTTPKPDTTEIPAGKGLHGAACSPVFSFTPKTPHLGLEIIKAGLDVPVIAELLRSHQDIEFDLYNEKKSSSILAQDRERWTKIAIKMQHERDEARRQAEEMRDRVEEMISDRYLFPWENAEHAHR